MKGERLTLRSYILIVAATLALMLLVHPELTGFAVFFNPGSVESCSNPNLTFAPSTQGTANVTQGDVLEIWFNMSNVNGDTINFSVSTIDKEKFEVFYIKTMNETLGLVNVTPGWGEVHESSPESINVLVQRIGHPLIECQNSIDIYVWNVNDAPILEGYSPDDSTPTVLENTSIEFNATVSDKDIACCSDNLTFYWYLDSVLQTDNISVTTFYGDENGTYAFERWTYYPGFCDQGPKNVTVVVMDLSNESVSVEWDLTVNDSNRAPQFDFTNNITDKVFNEDTNYSEIFDLDDHFSDDDWDQCGTPETYTLVYSSSGNTVTEVLTYANATTHRASFYTTSDYAGELLVKFNMTDGYLGVQSNTFLINTTNVNDPPVIDSMENKTIAAGVRFIYYLNATDADLPSADSLMFSDNSSLFDISTINPTFATGLIDFTPIMADVGDHPVVFCVNDTADETDCIEVLLSITSNNVPAIDPLGYHNATYSVLFELFVNASDADNDTLVFSDDTGIFEIITVNATLGLINFTPAKEDSAQNYTIYVRVTDTKGAYNESLLELEIFNINEAPVLDPLDALYKAKINRTFNLFVNATDPDVIIGDVLDFTDNASLFNISKSGPLQAYITFNSSVAVNETVTITVTDQDGLNHSRYTEFRVLPNYPPVIDAIPDQNATKFMELELNVSATDENEDPLGEYFTTNFTRLIKDPIYTDTSARFTFTPNASDVGMNYSVRVTVHDGDGGLDTEDFILRVLDHNYRPWLDPISDQLVFENQTVIIGLYGYDQDEDNLTFKTNLSFLSVTYVNRTYSFINYTGQDAHVGTYFVNVTVYDEANQWNTTDFRLDIYNTNDAPNITSASPAGYDVLMTENSSQAFSVTAVDTDLFFFDNLTFRWYIDDVEQSDNKTGPTWVDNVTRSAGWTYDADFTSSGSKNITVTVTDINGSSDFRSWTVNVSDMNRAPYFKYFRHDSSADFNPGTKQNTTVVSGSVRMASNGTHYYETGYYMSPVIDNQDPWLAGMFPRVDFSATVPNGTSLEILIRTSMDNVDWTNWTGPFTSSFSLDTSQNARYMQYLANLTSNSTDTPSLEVITVYQEIANITLPSGETHGWFDLDYYFEDPDTDDTLSYTSKGNESIRIYISGGAVTVETPSGFNGMEIVYFVATDGTVNVTSNNITINVEYTPPVQVPVPQSGGGSSGGSRIVIQEVPEPEPVHLKIIVPKPLSIYTNDTILAPITLENPTNLSLQDIVLSAHTNVSNISLQFVKTHIGLLDPGHKEETSLLISSYNIEELGSFEILVIANVSTPPYQDTAIIFMNAIERATENDTQMELRIAYIQDFILANPECLELIESLNEAKKDIAAHRYTEAVELLDRTMAACRYLVEVAGEEHPEVQAPGVVDRMLAVIRPYAVIIALSLTALLTVGVFMIARSGHKRKKS